MDNTASKLLRFLCTALLAAAAASAQAVDWGMSDTALHDLSYDATNQLLTSQVLRDAARGSRAPRRAAAGQSTLAPGSASVSVPRQLAAQMPAAQRGGAQRHFEQLLQAYHQIESRFGLPRNDVAGAMAAFLAGALMAYRNEDFPDAYFKPLVDQMRPTLGANAQFQRAAGAERREMYERLAILGMSMATTQMALKRQPDEKVRMQVRAVAKRHLEQFLKVDPERVAVTAQGLVIR